MKKDAIAKLHTAFEDIVRHHPDSGGEFWFARDLQTNLGYAKWENFIKVVEKARTACATSGHAVENHFLEVRKKVSLGSGAERNISDMALTRYACYLIAMNGDASKEPIAFAQTYFAVQTRKQEVIEQRMAEAERLSARKKLTASEKQLSGIIYERVGVPDKRPLADFLPTITIKAKDFANEITNFNINKDDLRSEPAITQEHIKNNSDVRDVLIRRGIVPEALPAAEDVKKVERRLGSEAKKISKSVESLEPLPPGGEKSPSS